MSADSRFVHKIWQAEELSKMIDGGRIGKVWEVWKPETV